MSRAVRNLFDGIAHRYDFLNHLLSVGRDIAWRRKAVTCLANRPIASVLDLCGGTGDFLAALTLVRQGMESGVIADFSFSMLKGARPEKFTAQYKTLRQAGTRNTLPAKLQMDALHPACKPQSFDVVLCGYGMRNLDDLQRGIASVHNLLKPGGTFVTLEFFRPGNPLTFVFYRLLAPLFIPFLGFLFSGRKSAYDYLIRSVRGFVGVLEYQRELEKAGFRILRRIACDGGISHIVSAEKIPS